MDVNVARTCKKLSFSILDWNWYLSRVAGRVAFQDQAKIIQTTLFENRFPPFLVGPESGSVSAAVDRPYTLAPQRSNCGAETAGAGAGATRPLFLDDQTRDLSLVYRTLANSVFGSNTSMFTSCSIQRRKFGCRFRGKFGGLCVSHPPWTNLLPP